ncbi:DUF4159 domain-containing protein [Neogemmobacter tilapiae]|uniref:LytTR family transcriptional regulator n=1 Tax=Neogemmobacter tilapiae TaxID=875041 RepID=A0A918TU36_9RHOB|nr:DUF4159 domain-containing protein [Gemmobacter tilapiae]GHC63425.1 LytTR family transcriptional regulator [Gemmobacter tilapiae]
MWMIGPIGFTAPLLLLGLILLPVLWFLLRAIPPAPIKRRFPGVALLLGLDDETTETDKTPWWLLLLRALAIAAAIIAFAGPVLNPQARAPGNGPLLVLIDGGWADARDWTRRQDRSVALVEEAGRNGRPVAVVRLSDAPEAVVFQTADAVLSRLAAMEPQPFAPNALQGWVDVLPAGEFDSFWLSNGLDHEGRAVLETALQNRGALTVFSSPRPIFALHPASFAEGMVKIAASRLPATGEVQAEVVARGLDPSGIERELARVAVTFPDGQSQTEAAFDLPPELRNRITRFELVGQRTAGAVSLTDDSLKRRKIALITGESDAEGLLLLSQSHYLRQALAPVADLLDGGLQDVLLANPDVIVLADVARLSAEDEKGLLEWIQKGGLLLRFAGPRMAASESAVDGTDPLLPVTLRQGGRAIGGAMSWGEPKPLAPFAEDTPFHGLEVPPEVTVTEQVLAQPGPELAGRTIAALADGTPLVTRRVEGQGQVVLVHVTANADWSNLPLSVLFVQMLERLAVSTRPAVPEESDLAGQIWVPEEVVDAYGQVVAVDDLPGVPGEDLAKAIPGRAMPPGLYAGAERRVALNVMAADTALTPAEWAEGVAVEGIEMVRETALKGAFLSGALALLMVDILAALFLSGRLAARLGPGVAVLILALALMPQGRAQAQDSSLPDDALALEATTALRLAYVMTDDQRVNDMAKAGLLGLSMRLWDRTTVEPLEPIGVDLEKDDLAFFPFLYWPMTANQPIPSSEAYAKLNRFMRTGGMLFLDSRDGGMTGSPEQRRMQEIALRLDIPPLEPIPPDHVLTRTFYLLQDFPGRFIGQPLWVEAAPPDAEQAEGMPFRNLNDGVTPVVLGSADYAAAWAVDDYDQPLVPVGRGNSGERQREIAYRFGINLIMHVLTGNYKSDQVHVPALLERLGQ